MTDTDKVPRSRLEHHDNLFIEGHGLSPGLAQHDFIIQCWTIFPGMAQSFRSLHILLTLQLVWWSSPGVLEQSNANTNIAIFVKNMLLQLRKWCPDLYASFGIRSKQMDADGNQIWQNKTNERLTDFDKAAKLNWDRDKLADTAWWYQLTSNCYILALFKSHFSTKIEMEAKPTPLPATQTQTAGCWGPNKEENTTD